MTLCLYFGGHEAKRVDARLFHRRVVSTGLAGYLNFIQHVQPDFTVCSPSSACSTPFRFSPSPLLPLLPGGVLSSLNDLAVGETGADGILPLRASAFALVATLCAVLGMRAFPRLPRFFPAMLQALESETTFLAAAGGGQSLLWTSALSAVATVAASLPSFLSPYLGRILAVALRPAAAAAASALGSGGGSAAAGSKQAADRVLSLLAAGVEPRLLVPAVCGAYAGCVEGIQEDKEEERVTVAARSVARLLAYVQEVRMRVVWEASLSF